MKMIQAEYPLTRAQFETLAHRMLADDKEFEKVWKLYKTKNARYAGGVDDFKLLLLDLVS